MTRSKAYVLFTSGSTGVPKERSLLGSGAEHVSGVRQCAAGSSPHTPERLGLHSLACALLPVDSRGGRAKPRILCALPCAAACGLERTAFLTPPGCPSMPPWRSPRHPLASSRPHAATHCTHCSVVRGDLANTQCWGHGSPDKCNHDPSMPVLLP